MIAGAVYVDMTSGIEDGYELSRRDRRSLSILTQVPDGAKVIVDIGARRYIISDAAPLLHEHDHRLIIEVRGVHPEAVRDLVCAARSGDWSAIA